MRTVFLFLRLIWHFFFCRHYSKLYAKLGQHAERLAGKGDVSHSSAFERVEMERRRASVLNSLHRDQYEHAANELEGRRDA